LILSWTGSGIEDSFAISVNGARIGVVPANVHQWNDNLAPPGIRTYCVIAINEFGESPPSCVTVDCSGGIVQAALPHRDRLGPDGIRISPNPFNPTTRIEFELTEAQHVQLNIFDIQGRVVETLVNEQLASGTHSHLWDAAQMPSGIYWAQLVAGSDIRIEKLLLMK
jgi:hypothetical protein